MKPTNDGWYSQFTVAAGQLMRLLDLSGAGGDGCDIADRQFGGFPDVPDLVIGDIKAVRGHPRQRQQTEARERGQGLATLDESRQGHAESREFGIERAQSAHGDQRELHRSTSLPAL